MKPSLEVGRCPFYSLYSSLITQYDMISYFADSEHMESDKKHNEIPAVTLAS